MNSILAIDGGKPAVSSVLPKMFPGGLRIGDEELAAVTDVIQTKRVFRYYGAEEGPSRVAELELAAASRLGAPFVQAVSSGCGALMVALAALGVGPGDEVIVPAFTWIATASAVVGVGGIPIVAEVDQTLNMDPEDLRRKITPRTKAIALVYMRGGTARYDEIAAVAKEAGIPILEDTAQAMGATFRGRCLGTLSEIGIYSFQFNKILTCGEGGLVVTHTDEMRKRVAMIHDVVGALRYAIPEDEVVPGMNYRMSELQGAVALAQLPKLDSILSDMRRNREAIRNGIREFVEVAGGTWRVEPDPAGDAGIALVFFLPTVSQAQWTAHALSDEGLPTMNLYSDETDYHFAADWAPIIRHASWSSSGAPWCHHPNPPTYSRGDWPRTSDLLRRSVHLDISPDYTEGHVSEIIDACRKVLPVAGLRA